MTTDRTDQLTERLFERRARRAGAVLRLPGDGARALPRRSSATARSRPTSSPTRAGIAPRYAREWLEQQAVAGSRRPRGRPLRAARRARARAHRRRRPRARRAVRAHARRHRRRAPARGRGVPHRRRRPVRGVRLRVPPRPGPHQPAGVHARAPDRAGSTRCRTSRDRLEQGGRVADVGCGQGFSTVAMAQRFPRASVEGFDADAGVDPRRPRARGRTSRPRFVAGDATTVRDRGPYDLVLVLETLHDLPHPVQTLAAVARRASRPAARRSIVDERVADTFAAPGDEVERMMYGWSVTHCLPTQMVEQPSAALGTVLRADTVRELAAEAGFARRRRPPRRERLLPPLPAQLSHLSPHPLPQGAAPHDPSHPRPAGRCSAGGRRTRRRPGRDHHRPRHGVVAAARVLVQGRGRRGQQRALTRGRRRHARSSPTPRRCGSSARARLSGCRFNSGGDVAVRSQRATDGITLGDGNDVVRVRWRPSRWA